MNKSLQKKIRSFAVLLVLSITFFLPENAFARAAGIRLGWNYANVSKTSQSGSEISTARHSGFYIAGTGEENLSSVFFFHGEVGFIQRGYAQTTGATETRYRANYFFLAPMIKAKALSNIKLVPEFGPSFGFKTSERVESQTGSTTTVVNQKQFGFFDFGLLFGLGFEYPLSGGLTLVGGLRYNLGIKDVDEFETIQTKHRGTLLYSGISFTF